MPRVTAPIIPGAEPFSQTGSAERCPRAARFHRQPTVPAPLAEALAGAGYTVDLPLLPGHGTAVEDMIPTRWADWSGAAESAYEKMAARL
jgi:carboxylesterase